MLRKLVIVLAVLFIIPAAASAAGSKISGAMFPAISPDGKWIAFTYHGDIWLVAKEGGNARHITLHEAYDFKPRFSPDGKHIAFTSNRLGNYDVYVSSIEGGVPKRLTCHSSGDVVCSWTPDGKAVVFYSYRGGEMQVWSVPFEGGTPEKLTKLGGTHAQLSPDGKKVIFSRGTNSTTQRQYNGSGNWDIYISDVNGVPKKITTYLGNDFYPFFGADGKTIYYLSERQGTQNIFKTSIVGGDGIQVTKLAGDGMLSPCYCKKSGDVVFEYNFGICYMKLEGGKPTRVPITANADTRGYDFVTRHVTTGAENPCMSPDGRNIAFSLRGDIWVMSSTGGVAKQLTKGPAQDKWPRYSPDGAKIAYYSNANGNDDIFILDIKSGESAPFNNTARDEHFHSWSPDGRKIVFSRDTNENRDIWVAPVDGGPEKQLTTSPGSDDDPRFTPDGRSIVFDSSRGGTQDVWIMDADGSNQRALTTSRAFNQLPMISPDGKFLVYESTRNRSRGIWVMELASKLEMQVAPQGSGPCYSPDGKWIIFEKGTGADQKIFRIEAPRTIPQGQVISFIAETKVERRKEMEQVFDEAHMLIRNGFYDSKFHGVNWDAMKRKYKPLAVASETKDELSVFISRMIGELKASHLGFYTKREGQPVHATTGELGVEFEGGSGERGIGLKVKSVMQGSPADKAWIRPGDYIFAVNRNYINNRGNFFKMLNDTVGKKITLSVGSSPRPSEARLVNVEPVDASGIYKLRYQNQMQRNMRLVASKSSGQVGYIHLRRMMPPELAYFQLQLQLMRRKSALILDVRDNSGGNIHQQLLDILSRRPFGKYQVRGGRLTEQPGLYWDKPLVILINERSFSDAEVFAHSVKALRLGEVIGVPTPGGVIGTNEVRLVDGSTFRLPRVGWFSLAGKNMEGKGCRPTIFVAITPSDQIDKRDPQLEKAVEVVMNRIAIDAAFKEKKKREEAAKEAAQKKKKPAKEPEKPEEEDFH